MTVQFDGPRMIYDDGRIVVERTPSGWSIACNDPNPETRYLVPALSLWDSLRRWAWRRRMQRWDALAAALPQQRQPGGAA